MPSRAESRREDWYLGPFVYACLSPIYLTLIYGGPASLVILSLSLPTTLLGRLCLGCSVPLLYALAFAVIAGSLSQLHQHAIVPGTFTRSLRNRIYFHRRLYGLCWTTVYYCKPIYSIVLSLPVMKRITFRLFGYRGSLDISIYPDTWIRDLPLLHLEKGVYLSNRATLGTNIALANGDILVNVIKLGTNVCVGHLSMLGPGVTVGEDAEIGVGSTIGIRAEIGPKAKIGPTTKIGHGAHVHSSVVTGAMCCIGSKAVLWQGLVLPNCSFVPNGTILETQDDVEHFGAPRTQAVIVRSARAFSRH